MRIRGSDLFLQLTEKWVARYPSDVADLRLNIAGGGTGAGFASFAKGDAEVTIASRRIKDQELTTARPPAGAAAEVQLVARQSNSAGYLSFRIAVLGSDRERRDILRMASNRELIAFVQRTKNAIACIERRWAGEGVKQLAIRAGADKPPVLPTPASCADGSYPLVQPIYVYYRDEPSGRVKELVRWLRGAEGRELLAAHGISSVQ